MTQQLLTIDTDIEPLSEYLDFQPGEDQFFDDLVEDYGNHLQTLTKREKLFMLAFIANSLALEADGDINNKIIYISQKCFANFGRFDLLGLCSAIADQIRCGYYALTPNNKTGEA